MAPNSRRLAPAPDGCDCACLLLGYYRCSHADGRIIHRRGQARSDRPPIWSGRFRVRTSPPSRSRLPSSGCDDDHRGTDHGLGPVDRHRPYAPACDRQKGVMERRRCNHDNHHGRASHLGARRQGPVGLPDEFWRYRRRSARSAHWSRRSPSASYSDETSKFRSR